MDKKFIILTLIMLLISINAINAEQVTMDVGNKHIIGIGTGNQPVIPNDFYNIVYVISETECNGYYSRIVQEYPVTVDDYAKIKIGDKVTLETPEHRDEPWKVITITPQSGGFL